MLNYQRVLSWTCFLFIFLLERYNQGWKLCCYAETGRFKPVVFMSILTSDDMWWSGLTNFPSHKKYVEFPTDDSPAGSPAGSCRWFEHRLYQWGAKNSWTGGFCRWSALCQWAVAGCATGSRRVHFCPIDFQKSLLNFELFFSVLGVWVGLRQPAGQKSFSCPKNRRGLNEAKKRL